MSGEGEQISAETAEAPAPAPASPAPEPQARPPVSTIQEEQITTVKEQVVVKKTTSPEKPAPVPTVSTTPAAASHHEQETTRPRKPKSSSKVAEYSSSSKKSSSSSKSASSSYGKSSRSEYGDILGVGAALAREFRGTSPSVLENIATHPLLYSPSYEPLKQPHLSARSRKALRDAADLAVIAPGLKNLLEVQYHFLFRSAYWFFFKVLFGVVFVSFSIISLQKMACTIFACFSLSLILLFFSQSYFVTVSDHVFFYLHTLFLIEKSLICDRITSDIKSSLLFD